MISIVAGGFGGFALIFLIALPRYIHTRKNGGPR